MAALVTAVRAHQHIRAKLGARQLGQRERPRVQRRGQPERGHLEAGDRHASRGAGERRRAHELRPQHWLLSRRHQRHRPRAKPADWRGDVG